MDRSDRVAINLRSYVQSHPELLQEVKEDLLSLADKIAEGKMSIINVPAYFREQNRLYTKASYEIFGEAFRRATQ